MAVPRWALGNQRDSRFNDLARAQSEEQRALLEQQGRTRAEGTKNMWAAASDVLPGIVKGYQAGQSHRARMAEDERAAETFTAGAPGRQLGTQKAQYGLDNFDAQRQAEEQAAQADTDYKKAQVASLTNKPGKAEDWAPLSDPDANGNVVFYNKADPAQRKIGPKMGQKPGTAKPNADFDALPMENQIQIKNIADKNASISVAHNGISSGLVQLQGAKNKDDAIRIGNSMLKSLNSLVSSDAIGKDEAERIGNALEFQIANFTGPGPTWGTDLAGFERQLQATLTQTGETMAANKNQIEQLYGRAPAQVVSKPNMGPTMVGKFDRKPLGPFGVQPALAAPPRKAPEAMTQAELDAYEASLTGGPQ